MKYTLILDTSHLYLSLALMDEIGKIIYSYKSKEKQSHAKNSTLEIEKAILETKLSFSDIQYIAINSGPGSFTGLRVGASVAKGLALSLGAELIALCGLESYALEYYRQKKLENKELYLLRDARRDNFFYTKVFNEKIETSTAFSSYDNIKKLSEKDQLPTILKEEEIADFITAENLNNEVFFRIKQKNFENINMLVPNYFLNTYVGK